MVDYLDGDEIVDWIQCSNCFSWYHCVCIGIQNLKIPEFQCCGEVAPHISNHM